MAKKKPILGVDVGHDRLKLAVTCGGVVLQTASAPMPKNLVQEGKIISNDSMAELIKMTMKETQMRASVAAYILPNESVYVKNVELPMMTADQLKYNLPFEFNDYVTGEVKDYIFDYAVLPQEEKEGEDEIEAMEKKPKLEVLAVGATREEVDTAAEIMKKAGLKLVKAAPELCAYISLIRAQREVLSTLTESASEEYGILDLGYDGIRLYMYKGDRYVATRALETGLSTLDDVIKDEMGVEEHLAHTYLMTNFEDCQHREVCMMAYERIAVELNRALNFYRFSNPDSSLADIWLCGGGAMIEPLAGMIAEMMDEIRLHTADELVPDGLNIEECNSFVQAIGITMD